MQQDLQETCVQLTQGVQEWQDGCVYRGQFGTGVKMGSGEFSWPTGEVTGFQCFLPPRPGLDQGPSRPSREGPGVSAEAQQQEGGQADASRPEGPERAPSSQEPPDHVTRTRAGGRDLSWHCRSDGTRVG